MYRLPNKKENAYVFVKPYDVKPIEGYQPHKNKDVSKKFPKCCEFHKLVLKALEKKNEDNYPEFKKRFEKENKIELDDTYYKSLSNKIIKQVSYSEYFISQKIDSESWFQDIVHYIDYNIFSFGNPNSGCLWYLNMLRYYLEEVDKELDDSKKKRIIEYLNLKADNKNSSAIQSDDSNPKLIYQTLKKWRSLIPFKVPDFDKIGDYKDWIIVTGIQDVNPYNGMIKINTVTKSELVELLKNYTKSLIQMVDSTYS